jgi:hypothetical protein
MPSSPSSRRVLPSRNARAENINYSDTLIAPTDGGYREEDPSEVVGVSGGVGEVDHNENYNAYEADNYVDEVSW